MAARQKRGARGLNQTKRLEATVHGRVQGVGFRWYVQRRAERLGLTGWVANESSGQLRVVAEGPADVLAELLDDLRSGPPGAIVDRVDERLMAPGGTFTRFDIRVAGHTGD